MKKNYLLLLLSFSLSQLGMGQNDSINFEHNNFDNILLKAKSSDKYVFLDAYTTWCAPCRNMSKNVFTVDRVAQYFNMTFINAKVDMERGEGLTLRDKYKIVAYPTFLLLDSDGNEIDRIIGGFGPDDFINRVKDGLGNNSLSQMEIKYKQNQYDNAFVINYIKKLSAAYKKEEAEEVTNQYFNTLSLEEKISPKNWFIFDNRRLTSYGSDRYKFVIENRKTFQESVGKEKVEQLIYIFTLNSFFPYLQGSIAYDADRMRDIEQEVMQVQPINIEDIALLIKLTDARGKKDFNQFINLVDSYAANVNDNTLETIVRVMGFIAEEGGTKEECIKASEVLSKLYYKSEGEVKKEYHTRVVNYLKRGPNNFFKNK